MSAEISLPHPVPEALRIVEKGHGIKGLHVANPFTGQHTEITTVPSLNPEQDGQTIIEVKAPNGTSYWKTTGEHIIGNYPEGTIYLNEPTDWEKQQNNAFINPIWSGVK